MPRVSAQLQAEVIRDVLDPREQQLYLKWKGGKSLHALAQIYRQFEGENGVREHLNELEALIQAAAEQRLNGGATSARAEHARRDEDDDNSGGIPIKRTSAKTPDPKPQATPPSQAPPPSPSAQPSTASLDADRRTPARSVVPATARRDERVEALLREEPRSAANMAERLGISRAIVRKALERLALRKVAESSGEATWDYRRKIRSGPPAVAWRIVGDTRTVRVPAADKRPHPSTPAARDVAGQRDALVLAALRERPRSQRALAGDLDSNAHLIRQSLTRLEGLGKVKPSGVGAHDWTGAINGRGRPSNVWEAVGGPAYERPTPPPVAIAPNGVATYAPSLAKALGSVDRIKLAEAINRMRSELSHLEQLLAIVDALRE